MSIQEHQKRLRAMIREHGWIVQGVFPHVGDSSIPFGYTIGLTTAGLPELILSGPFKPAMTQELLNNAANIHLAKEIKPGDLVEDIATMPTRAVAARVGTHVQQALNFYDDVDNLRGRVRLVQLLWPSKDGKFPGEDADLDLVQQTWPLR